jgi:hypothetical protein
MNAPIAKDQFGFSLGNLTYIDSAYDSDAPRSIVAVQKHGVREWLSRLLATGIAAAIVGLVVAAAAQTFPSRPIRLIVTFPPGGSTDTMARTLQPSLERASQPIGRGPGAGEVTLADWRSMRVAQIPLWGSSLSPQRKWPDATQLVL